MQREGDVTDLLVVALLLAIVAGILYLVWRGLDNQRRKAGRPKRRVLRLSGVLVVILALFSLPHSTSCTRHSSVRPQPPKEPEDKRPRRAIMHCYHKTMRDFGPRNGNQAPIRRRALERVQRPRPSYTAPVNRPKAKPEPEKRFGPSCSLHPRVLSKILASIEQNEREARS